MTNNEAIVTALADHLRSALPDLRVDVRMVSTDMYGEEEELVIDVYDHHQLWAPRQYGCLGYHRDYVWYRWDGPLRGVFRREYDPKDPNCFANVTYHVGRTVTLMAPQRGIDRRPWLTR